MQQRLVSILIPTHNRLELFKIAFQSALNQTYKNIEIIISDDSDDDETYRYMQDYLQDKRVIYQWNKGFDAEKNWKWPLDRCHGEYFNYLMDDDFYAPDKIEKMVAVYEKYPNVSLVTSHRQIVDINGKHRPDVAATKPITDNSSVVSGETIAREILRTNTNFIGEPTTVLIRSKYREIMENLVGSGSPIADVMMWLELCKRGDVAYLTDTLSYFRLHAGNDQNKPVLMLIGWSDWSRLYHQEYENTTDVTRKVNWAQLYLVMMSRMIDLWLILPKDERQNQEELEDCRHRVHEAVEVYLHEFKGKIAWQASQSVKAFIEEYGVTGEKEVRIADSGKNMKVVILAGGYGTRIMEESVLRPKPMVEIGGMPILWHIMKEYSYYGFNDFILCVGYKQHMIKEFFANYFLRTSDVTFDFTQENRLILRDQQTEPWTVTVVDTGLSTMTGGRIKRVQPYIGSETFMMTYGDGVCDVDIRSLVEFHRAHGKCATITTVRQKQQKGVLDIDWDNSVRGFREKNVNDSQLINAGYMVLEPDVFKFIDDDRTVFEKTTMNRLVEAGELMSYRYEGFWQCMDTRLEMSLLEKLWEQGTAPWKVW